MPADCQGGPTVFSTQHSCCSIAGLLILVYMSSHTPVSPCNRPAQVLWSYSSALKPGGYNADDACRAYIALSLGLLEPSFLLLVLFSSSFAVNRRGASPDNPNLFILALTVGLTLPMCAAQVFAALFSR